MTTQQIVKWAGGFVVGVGTIIWLYGTFLTKAEHTSYVNNHEKWSQQVLSEIHGDINELKADNKDLKAGHILILRKLDNIETRIMIKGKEGVGLYPTNYNYLSSLIYTNLYE